MYVLIFEKNFAGEEFKMSVCDCITPDVISTNEFVVCRQCGVVMERVFTSKQNYSIKNENSLEIYCDRKEKKILIRSGRKETDVHKDIRSSQYALVKSLQYYDSISDHRIFCGYSSPVIIGTIGLLQMELDFVRNYQYSLRELVSISSLYSKLGGKNPIFPVFAEEIIPVLKESENSSSRYQNAKKLIRCYYKRYLTMHVSQITPEMSKFIGLTSRVVNFRLFWLFVKIFRKMFSLTRQIPCAIRSEKISILTKILCRIIDAINYFMPSQSQNFYIRVMFLLSAKKQKISKEQKMEQEQKMTLTRTRKNSRKNRISQNKESKTEIMEKGKLIIKIVQNLDINPIERIIVINFLKDRCGTYKSMAIQSIGNCGEILQI